MATISGHTVVLAEDPMGKNVLKSSPLKPVSQYSKHVIDGQVPKLCSVIPISVQNGRRQRT
jgi:hypothetical protein